MPEPGGWGGDGGGPAEHGFDGGGSGGDHINSAPNPARVSSLPVKDLTVDAGMFNDAADEVDAFNDTFAGKVSSFLGFEKHASQKRPGEIDTTFNFNPLDFGLNLATAGMLGTLGAVTGLTDFADFEVVNFSDLKGVQPSGNAIEGGGGVRQASLPGFTPSGASSDLFASWAPSDGLSQDIFGPESVPDADAGSFDLGSEARTFGDAAAQVAAVEQKEPSALPALLGVAALIVELS